MMVASGSLVIALQSIIDGLLLPVVWRILKGLVLVFCRCDTIAFSHFVLDRS